jgi:antitoxin CptB
MAPYMAAPEPPRDMPDPEDHRRRRLVFRAQHRGTREADLMIGGFVAQHIAGFTNAELDELEAALEFPDVDLADWLSGRRAIPAEFRTPMLDRMAAACAAPGSGWPGRATGGAGAGRPAPGMAHEE